jgi:hypothetical protein
MANDPVYGKPFFPSTGPYLFAGSFIQTLLARVFQGGLSSRDTITARAGGLQPLATQLIASFNNVTVCATGGDSVALPKAIQGSEVVVFNNGVASMNVFAKVGSGDTINGTAGTTAFAHANAKRVTYTCVTTGKWLTSTAAIP